MLRRSALALLTVGLAGPAFAQAYPTKPITMIVPFAAGGPTDLMARIVGERMSKELGQQIIIDNVTGAAGSIAMGKLAHAAPDGYTIGIGHLGTNVVNGIIYKDLNYDLLVDLVPIARLPSNPLLVVTSNQVPAKDLKELVAYLKANADKISGGTAGMGSGSHIGVLAFFAATGTNYQLVPYRGTGPAVQDLIANQIQIMIDQSSNSLPHVRAGKVRGLATTGLKRAPVLPELPTMIEAGVPDFEATTWIAVFAAAGTPRNTIVRLYNEMAAILAMPVVKERLDAFGLEIAAEGPDALGALLKSDTKKWSAVIQKAGIAQLD